MTSDLERPCPPWCHQPAGHLHVEPAGPGDHHLSEATLIDLPEIPGLRGETTVQVSVEQYVTATTAYPPTVSLGLGDDGADSETLTFDEAEAVASALTQAVAAARTAQARRPHDDDDAPA